MRYAKVRPAAIAQLVCVLEIGTLTGGCSPNLQQYVFVFEGEEEFFSSDFMFCPVVEVGEHLVPGQCWTKTFDASGYHKTDVSASNPRNLYHAWRTPDLSGYSRVGVVISRGIILPDEYEMQPVWETARVFWFDQATINSTSDVTRAQIPEFESLDRIELQPHWRQQQR